MRLFSTFAFTFAFSAFAFAPSDARADETTPSDDSAPFAGKPPGGGSAPMAAVASSFGAVGAWALTMQTGPGSGFLFFHKPSAGDWELSIHPALDYFVTSSVSIGGVVGYYHSPAQTGTTNLDLGGRAGFNLNINDRLSLWPTAGLTFRVASANHDTNTSTALNVFAPFLYHPAPHFFVGLGPEFQLGLSGGDYKQYGVDFVIGGWI